MDDVGSDLEFTGQDITFLNSNQNLVNLNPSFSGSNGLIRNQLSYRIQWPNISGTYTYYRNSFDMYLRPIHGGIALTAESENGLNGLIENSALGLAYAQYFSLKGGRAKLIPSAQVFYRQVVRNYSELRFHWIPPGVNNSTQPLPPQERKSFADLNAGLLYTLNDRLFVGVSASHLTSPELDMIYDYVLFPRYSFYGSYNFILSDRSVLQTYLNVIRQELYSYSMVGANILLYKHLMAGAAYGSADKIMLNAGYRTSFFAFSLLYDRSVSKLSGNTAGSWEVHASYNLRDKEHRKLVTSFEKM